VKVSGKPFVPLDLALMDILQGRSERPDKSFELVDPALIDALRRVKGLAGQLRRSSFTIWLTQKFFL
jgi:hypothetical protein